MTQPATVETPPAEQAAPSAPAPAESLDLTKGWEAEAYTWSAEDNSGTDAGAGESSPAPASTPEKPAEEPKPGTPPASPDSSPDPSKPAGDPPPAAATNVTELTDEQLKTLIEDPRVRAEIDRRAHSRAGNLRQQEEAQRQREETAEQKWAEATAHYDRLQKLAPDEYKAEMQKPGVAQWLAQYEAVKAERTAPVDVKAVREQVLTEGLQQWNVEAAKAFGQSWASVPFYKDLPAAFRANLEAGSQVHADKTWLEEYVEGLQAGMLAWHKKAVDAAVLAAKNEMHAEAGGQSPVVVQGQASGPELTAQQILARHMDFGTDVANGGVTEEQLEQAKKTLGRNY